MRADQWQYTLTVDGQDYGIWSQKTGGNVTAESNKDWPGGMAEPEEMGAPRQTEDIMLSRRYKVDRDHPVVVQLENRVGRGLCVVKGQPLDDDRNPAGDIRTWTGKLLGVEEPEHNAGGSERSTISVTIGVDGIGA